LGVPQGLLHHDELNLAQYLRRQDELKRFKILTAILVALVRYGSPRPELSSVIEVVDQDICVQCGPERAVSLSAREQRPTPRIIETWPDHPRTVCRERDLTY